MEITNRVAEGDLEVLDLAALTDDAPVTEFDLAPWLHRGLALREKEFRAHAAAHDWTAYAGHHVALYCATDAIIPTWAWMLVAVKLDRIARRVTVGRAADARREAFAAALAGFDAEPWRDRFVVVKGCPSDTVPASAYAAIVAKLTPVARKVMYGEPCSSVPLWRKPKAEAA